jgi:hypothetical protein
MRGILVLHERHFPQVIIQFNNGIKSRVMMVKPQFGQRDFLPKYLPKHDSPRGKRYAKSVA